MQLTSLPDAVSRKDLCNRANAREPSVFSGGYMLRILELNVSADKLPQIDMSYNGGNGYCPIAELMRAMVLRAVDDYNSTGENYDEAVEWLYSDEEEYVLSFNGICRHFGWDPGKTRDRIINPTHKISTRRRAA
jgi:hypothetical protein